MSLMVPRPRNGSGGGRGGCLGAGRREPARRHVRPHSRPPAGRDRGQSWRGLRSPRRRAGRAGGAGRAPLRARRLGPPLPRSPFRTTLESDLEEARSGCCRPHGAAGGERRAGRPDRPRRPRRVPGRAELAPVVRAAGCFSLDAAVFAGAAKASGRCRCKSRGGPASRRRPSPPGRAPTCTSSAPLDLSMALGQPSGLDHPEVEALYRTAVPGGHGESAIFAAERQFHSRLLDRETPNSNDEEV